MAPFFDDVDEGPAGGSAAWVRTSDGLRIRVGHWTGADVKGTVLLFTGRTEFIEKYGRVAAEMLSRGYATAAIDWRGQGLSDRMHDLAGMGHVIGFRDYQHDVAALLRYVAEVGLPRPYHLIAHSMGGGIGLRSLHEGLPVRSALFSAPMWGIHMTRPLRAFAWSLSAVTKLFGADMRLAPGQVDRSDLASQTLAENVLTNDAEMFAYIQNQLRAHPELGLGGPSTRWVGEAIRETRRLSQMPSPGTPVHTFLGTEEVVVDPQRIKDRMARWPNGELTIIDGGKHEMMMDAPAMRNRIFDAAEALFTANS